LILNGDSTHAGGTRIEYGQLAVNGNHTGTVTVAGPNAVLTGTGTSGAIQASGGWVSLNGVMTANQWADHDHRDGHR
jgi:uncharacterized protein with beta-barrel porin domain